MNDAVRSNTLKTRLNDNEHASLRRLCAFLGVQAAPLVRSLINKETSAHDRRRAKVTEGPVQGPLDRKRPYVMPGARRGRGGAQMRQSSL